MQTIPGNNFFIYTRGGNCFGFTQDMAYTSFSANTAVHPTGDAWRPFSKAIELTGLGQTDCAIVASVAQGLKLHHSVHFTWYYGHNDPRNRFEKRPLTPNMNVHCVAQVCRTMVAVSMDKHLELFDALTATRTRIISTDSPFQFFVRVNPPGFAFEMGEKFVQQTCIGFNSGSLVSFGIADLSSKKGDDVEMKDEQEESKDAH